MNYRDSHLRKGDVYDEMLSSSPFDDYMTRMETELLTEIIPRYLGPRVPRYLDFACGTGRVTRVVEKFAEVACGVDVSEDMLAHAKEKCPTTEFMHADLTKVCLDVAPFDLVTAFRFFGNAERELRSEVLHAISRYLKPGGYLILNNHRNSWSLQYILRRIAGARSEMDLSHSALRALLHEAGFQIVRAYGIGGWILRARWTNRKTLESRIASVLEPLSRFHLAAPFCPDAIIIARKHGED